MATKYLKAQWLDIRLRAGVHSWGVHSLCGLIDGVTYYSTVELRLHVYVYNSAGLWHIRSANSFEVDFWVPYCGVVVDGRSCSIAGLSRPTL